MRAVLQRSSFGQVTVEGLVKAQIGRGLTILLGIKKGDSRREAQYLMDKAVNLRIFPDDEDKMNLSLLDVGGEILLVSQFTLYGDARKGRRPSFSEAELPENASTLFDYCVQYIQGLGVKIQTGVFGADMKVCIENDGPCTILLDSEKFF